MIGIAPSGMRAALRTRREKRFRFASVGSRSARCNAYLLLLAAADDFGGNVRDLQIKGTVIAFAVGAFSCGAWLFAVGCPPR